MIELAGRAINVKKFLTANIFTKEVHHLQLKISFRTYF